MRLSTPQGIRKGAALQQGAGAQEPVTGYDFSVLSGDGNSQVIRFILRTSTVQVNLVTRWTIADGAWKVDSIELEQ